MPRLRKTDEPKAIMTFEVSTLNTLIRYALCTTISKSSIVNLHKLVEALDMRAYAYSPDITARLKILKYVCEARTTYGMTDIDVIQTYITNTYTEAGELLKEVEPLSLNTLAYNECTSISKIISERLQYIYIFKYKDAIIECLNKFSKGGWTSYYETVDTVKLQLQELLMNITTANSSNAGVLRRLNMAADNYMDVVDTIIRKAKMPSAVLQTGIRQLNNVLSPGFQSDRLYLFLGLTGRFKSGTLLNIADQICKFNPQIKPVEDGMRKTVLFISNENTIEETYARLLDMYSGIDDDIVRMSTEEAINCLKEKGGYKFSNKEGITIDFRYYRNLEMSTADLYNVINELADEGYKVIAVVLDYIARVASVNSNQEERFRIANIAKELKGVATYFSIPIITAQQVNREGNGIIDAAMRDDKTDLAKFIGSTAVSESYGLIYEADWVCLLNLEMRKSDNKWFLTFNRTKIRGKQNADAITYFNHPFIDEKRIRLAIDVHLQQTLSVISLASDLESIPQDDTRLMSGSIGPKLNGQQRMNTAMITNGVDTSSILDGLDLTGVVTSAA